MTAGKDRPLWYVSVYAPLKLTPNLIADTDLSPEELRLQAYQARSSNTFPQYVSLSGRNPSLPELTNAFGHRSNKRRRTSRRWTKSSTASAPILSPPIETFTTPGDRSTCRPRPRRQARSAAGLSEAPSRPLSAKPLLLSPLSASLQHRHPHSVNPRRRRPLSVNLHRLLDNPNPPPLVSPPDHLPASLLLPVRHPRPSVNPLPLRRPLSVPAPRQRRRHPLSGNRHRARSLKRPKAPLVNPPPTRSGNRRRLSEPALSEVSSLQVRPQGPEGEGSPLMRAKGRRVSEPERLQRQGRTSLGNSRSHRRLSLRPPSGLRHLPTPLGNHHNRPALLRLPRPPRLSVNRRRPLHHLPLRNHPLLNPLSVPPRYHLRATLSHHPPPLRPLRPSHRPPLHLRLPLHFPYRPAVSSSTFGPTRRQRRKTCRPRPWRRSKPRRSNGARSRSRSHR